MTSEHIGEIRKVLFFFFYILSFKKIKQAEEAPSHHNHTHTPGPRKYSSAFKITLVKMCKLGSASRC